MTVCCKNSITHKTKMNLLKQDHLLHSSSCSPSPNLLRRQTYNNCVENSSGKLTIMNTGLGGCNTVLLGGEYFKDHAPFVFRVWSPVKNSPPHCSSWTPASFEH